MDENMNQGTNYENQYDYVGQDNANQPGGPNGDMQPDDGRGFSIAALVLGILGIVGGFIPVVCYFTTICAILGIVFGVKGRKKAMACGSTSGLATAGFVLGIVGVAFAAIGLVCVGICSAAACASAGLY